MVATKCSTTIQRIFFVHNCNRSTHCLGALILLQQKKWPNHFVTTPPPSPPIIRPMCVPSLVDIQKRFYADINRKNLNFKLEKSKQLLTDNIELKRQRLRERKEILVQGIRDKKSKVQEKVREMEEIVERENIATIPNLLCVARSFLAPYIGYVIIQENYQLAIGLLVFAGITDLVWHFILLFRLSN